MCSKKQDAKLAQLAEGSRWSVEITDLQGRNLPVADLTSSDPYCVLRLCREASETDQSDAESVVMSAPQRTRVCYHTLNPVWSDEFAFPLANVLDPSARHRCHIVVKDRDLGSDDVLGTAQVALPIW
jgi:Ca2+-dependent lipid-binding protein